MRLLILYFSGTGNTHYVAGYLARKLARLRVDVVVRSIEEVPAAAPQEFDFLALGFPIYAMDSPSFVRDYLRHLPNGAGRGAFVFSTKGALAGGANRRNLQRLASQGYTALGEASVGMPGSDGLAFVPKGSLMARMAQHKNFDHLKSVDKLVLRMQQVIKGVGLGQPVDGYQIRLPRTAAPSPGDRLWQAAYERFTAPFKGRFAADAGCNQCLRCVHMCPAGSIRLGDGQILFGESCFMCMRCIHQCPQEAIQIGPGTVGKLRWRGPRGDFSPLRLYGVRDGVERRAPFPSLPNPGG